VSPPPVPPDPADPPDDAEDEDVDPGPSSSELDEQAMGTNETARARYETKRFCTLEILPVEGAVAPPRS